jgi:hypothetical protein
MPIESKEESIASMQLTKRKADGRSVSLLISVFG